jgi:hypothetical protein
MPTHPAQADKSDPHHQILAVKERTLKPALAGGKGSESVLAPRRRGREYATFGCGQNRSGTDLLRDCLRSSPHC